jgi:hypothetical protein
VEAKSDRSRFRLLLFFQQSGCQASFVTGKHEWQVPVWIGWNPESTASRHTNGTLYLATCRALAEVKTDRGSATGCVPGATGRAEFHPIGRLVVPMGEQHAEP